MAKSAFLPVLLLFIIVGCGKVDQTSSDSSTIVNPPPSAYNCYSDTPTNGYGECYSSSALFVGETVVDGIWSVYTQSNTNRTDGKVFYDRYQYGFDFFGDGSAGKQQHTDGYTQYREWGINDAGTAITVSTDGTYSYVSTFTSDNKCFEVSNNSETVKFCHESNENQDANVSATGLYYGPSVKFGNRTDYNFVVTEGTGTWMISGYGDNTAAAVYITFADNGTTTDGGSWGVSADGKIMEIDGIRYLVYQYLEPLSAQCIAVFELSGGTTTSVTWKLCKQ